MKIKFNNEKELKLNHLYSYYKNNFFNTDLYIEGASNLVCGDGDLNSKIVFIGEAPGDEEDKISKPFIGRSGKLLINGINEAGLKREEVFITNIVKCRPPKNRKPSKKEIEFGINLILKEELSIISPNLIVTLGSSSLNGLIESNLKITEVRGKIINSKYGNIFPTYHPSYILRNRSKKNIFFDDLKNAIKIANS